MKNSLVTCRKCNAEIKGPVNYHECAMKKDLASARKLSDGEERLMHELDAVRAERNKTVYALLEALKDCKRQLEIAVERMPLDKLWARLPETISIATEAIANAEK